MQLQGAYPSWEGEGLDGGGAVDDDHDGLVEWVKGGVRGRVGALRTGQLHHDHTRDLRGADGDML